VAIEKDSLVRLGETGVNVFRVIKVGIDDNLNRALIEAVDEPKPGVYQWPADLTRLVPFEADS
jgi:hypothetical protein